MKNRYATASAFVLATCSIAVLVAPACGGSSSSPGFGSPGGGSSSGAGVGSGSGTSSGGSGGTPILGSGSGGGSGGSGGPAADGGIPCPSGMQCNVSCSGGGTTTITGTILDPAGADPLYNVIAYVPSSPVGKLPSGVLTGADKCSCSALLQGDPLVYGSSDTAGKFTISNAPVGTNIPLVIQVGKWRKQVTVTTTACQGADAGKISLPKNATEGDIPDIAVSTGGADSLECLMRRIGLDATEYVPGWTQPGHVHIFNGSAGEQNPMTSAPDSTASLWDSTADLMKNDIVLLSCEGQEPAAAIPQNLEDYLNAGGRAFASHFHYAWFSGPLQGGGTYSAPADWGTNLAQWTGGGGGGGGGATATVGGTIVTTLTAGGAFPKGLALSQWLGNVNALGGTVAANELPVAAPRYNANVTTEKPSQSWIQLDPATDPTGAKAPTLYFSFDTPVNAPASSDGGGPQYCGRAVFSGLHVGGASYDGVNCTATGGGHGGAGNGQGCNTGHVAAAPPPTGCDTAHPLSPQEKALEFMLFDLSACVIPENVPPTSDAGVYIPK